MIRPRSLAIAVLFPVLLVPSAAMAMCDLFEPPVQCNARRLAQQQDEWRRAAEAQQELNRLRIQVSQNIGNARARFWTTYPDKPGADKAQAEFARWLWTKDIIYLRQNLQSPVFKDATGRSSSTAGMKALETMFSVPIDDGIPQAATPEFEAWVNAVRKKVFEGHTSNSTDDAFMQGFLSAWMGPSFWKAVASADKEYQAYVMARDWWEFDHVQRVPAGYDSPDAYGALLYHRWEKVPMAQAPGVYQTFARLVGPDAARAAARAVHDAPKDAVGQLVVTAKPPVKIGPGGSQVPDYDVPMPDAVIGTWASPVTAMEILATRGNARTYLLFLLREQNESGTRVDRTTQWTFAETAYNRLKLAFGEPAILEAAERVRTARKRMTSNTVMDQGAIGATRNVPVEALQDILARTDPAGYVKCALIFGGKLDSPAAVDTAYRKYLADHGEANVLATAKRMAAAKPYLFFSGEAARLEKELVQPTATAATPPAATADSPVYLAWRDFAPGAKATYVDLKPGATEPTPNNVLDRQTYRLRSTSATDVQVWVTQIVYDRTGKAHPPRDSEEAYPAKAARAASPARTGSEALTIKGQPLLTQWEQTQKDSRGCTITETTWSNDDVPGGVVRHRTDSVCNGRTMVQDRWLESFEGTRTRPAARSASATAAVAPSSPPLASVDLAQRAAPQPTAISSMTDEQIVRSQLSGFALMLVTSEPIDLPGIKAGQGLRAKVDVTPQLRVLQPADADRLRSVMDDVDVRLGLRLTGAMLAQPRLSVTVDSVTFRGQDIPVAMYELPQIMRVKPELAHTVVRGPVPDSYWELPAKTGMTFRAKPREADRGQERGSKMTERSGAKTR